MNKIKALMPSSREKKRYLAFEVLSDNRIRSLKSIAKAIQLSYRDLHGEIGLGKAGLIMLNNKYNDSRQRGIIKVSHTSLDQLRATLAFIKEIEEQEVIVQSIGASGIIKKAESRYLAM